MENQQTSAEKPSKKWLIYAIIGLVFISFRLMIFYVEYQESSEAMDVTYSDWVANHPTGDWLNVTNTKANLVGTIYTESLGGTSKPSAFFVPLQGNEEGQDDGNVHLLLRVTEGMLYERCVEMLSMDEATLTTEYLSNPANFLVDGPFDGYNYTSEDDIDAIRSAESSLAPRFKVLDYKAGFPFTVVYVMGAIALALLAYIISKIKR